MIKIKCQFGRKDRTQMPPPPLWNFSENSSILVGPSVPIYLKERNLNHHHHQLNLFSKNKAQLLSPRLVAYLRSHITRSIQRSGDDEDYKGDDEDDH